MVQIIISIILAIIAIVGLAWLWNEARWYMDDSGTVAAGLITLSVIATLILAIAIKLFMGAAQTGPYEFIRITGEKGMAERCYVSSGSLLCETSNNSTVLVREYRKVEVEDKK